MDKINEIKKISINFLNEKIKDLEEQVEIRDRFIENYKKQFSLHAVSHQREQFTDLLIWYKYNVGRDNIKSCKELAEEYINL